jgi:hypothetical protein
MVAWSHNPTSTHSRQPVTFYQNWNNAAKQLKLKAHEKLEIRNEIGKFLDDPLNERYLLNFQ